MEAKRSLSYSVLLHAGMFVLWIAAVRIGPLPSLFSPEEKKQTLWIEVTPNSTNESKVVDSARGEKVKDAAKDAFLGERTQVVDEQMVTQSPNAGAESRVSTAKNTRATQQAKADKGKPSSTIPSLSNLGVKMLPIAPQNQQMVESADEEEGSITAQAGGEYVKGFKTGEKTLLNTKEYVFYGYFQRIRKSLDKAWDRSLRAELDKYFRRGRQLAEDMDYVTQLMVTLNHDGQIVRIQVLSQSGTQDLDEASVKAFNNAGPFPNPPKGLVDKSGQIKIRWDFVVKT